MDNTQSIFYIVSIIVAVMTPIGAYIHVRTMLAALCVKVDTMWDVHLRSAVTRAVVDGVATINSPLMITLEAQEWCIALKDDLQKWYATLPKPIADRDLMFQIGKQFGSRLTTEICTPRNLNDGVCLLIAAAVAKNDSFISLPGITESGKFEFNG